MPIRQTAHKAYTALDAIFTDKEAWQLFKLSAYLETLGWTCLIIGIAAVVLSWPDAKAYIAIGGSIHGILYLFYIFIVIFAHRSLKWSIKRFIFAGCISVIPYGALVFEMWVDNRRKHGLI
jgi:integral membrane protein